MALIARFSYDVPFGKKNQAFEVLKKYKPMEKELGFPEGRLLVGSIGVAESRVVEEYEFDSLAALEAAWAKLNDPRMPAFQEEMAPFIVPGSHRWEVYRVREL